MSSAYKCDRCKCLFESFDKNLNPINEPIEDYGLEIKKYGICSDRKSKVYDLCPKCYDKLVKFMYEYKAEGEED